MYVDGLAKEEECDTHNEHWMVQPALVIVLEVCQPPPLHVAIDGAEEEGEEDNVEWRWFPFHVQWVDQHSVKECNVN